MSDESQITGTVNGISLTEPAGSAYQDAIENLRKNITDMVTMPPEVLALPVVNQFRFFAYAQAAHAFRVAVGGRVVVNSGRTVPHGSYVVEDHYFGGSRERGAAGSSLLLLRASVLNPTAKTPRFPRVPLSICAIVPDFKRAFDADGWRSVSYLLELPSYFANALRFHQSPRWDVMADMIEERWEYLQDGAVGEPGARFAPLLPYGPVAIANAFRPAYSVPTEPTGPPTLDYEADHYNRYPEKSL